MYGQGNYAPQFRHGPPATLPPPYQQGPPVPPPTYQQGPPAPPPPYHQGSPAPPPVYQQGPPPPPPPSFHHGPPAPPPSIHPGHPQLVQVPPPGMVNMGQPYLHPPPVHGSASVAPSYTTPQQTPQYPQNVHHVNPPVPPAPVPPLTGPSPPPPRMLPPPVPSPGQMLYRTSPPMPPHGTMQGLQHIRPLPPPPPSGFVPITPAPFASFTQGDAHPPSMPPPPPPPPPSSPPPLPPSPPPPSSPPPNNLAVGVSEASSLISSNPALDMSHHSGSDFCSDKVSDSAERNSKPVDNEVGPTQVKDDASIPGGCTYSEIDTSCKVDSVMVDGVAPKGQALIDLPLPPPKPVDEEVVRNIEILCQFIAKVGPEFENLARTKEAGNLKFAFLFGGEPGSAAAVGHEYFEWMKKKCHLEFKVRNESDQSDPAPRPSEIESSLQSISSIDDGLSVSPAVSDMDVEDDVNQSDKDEGICQSIEDSKGEPALVCNEALLLKGQLHATQSSTKPLMQEDVSGTLSRSGSSPLFSGQGKEDDQSTFARPHTEDHSLVRSSSKAIECTLDSNMQASNKRLIEDSSPVKVSPPAGRGNSEEIPRVIIKDGSPFKLIQDYASDDSDDDKGTCLEDVSPVRVSPPVTQDISCVNEDKRNDMDSDLDVKNVSTTEIGFSIATGVTEAAQNSDSSALLNKVASPIVIVPDSLDSGKKTDELSIHKDECQMSIGGTESSEAFNRNDALRGNDFDIDVQPEKFHQEVDAKRASTAVNVDEFGRLVREGGSDSDSDGMRYAGRRSKRGRSWSRSRSPQEGRWRRRSRSPWRRRDKRSRSRSWSPKKHRSRSKSPPAFRRIGEFGNEKMRRDNRSQPECFNFLRGRCYRGASCRFLHRDSAVGDARRWNRGKQEPYQEFQQDTRDPTLHGDAHYAVEAHEAKNSMGVELSADRHDFSHEEGKNLDVQTGLDMSLSSVEATKDEDLDDKKGQDSLKEDMQPAISNEFGQSQVTITSGELSPSQGSKEALDQIQEPQEAQLVQEGPGIQPPEEEGSQQPVESQETFQPPPADSFATGPEPVAETHKSPGDVIGETSVPQPPQSNISDSLSVPELQNVSTHPPHVEGSLTSHPLPVQTFPPSSFSNQPPQSQSYPNQVPLAPSYPDQMPLGQPYPNQVPGSQPFPSESFRPPPFPQPPSFPGGDFRFPPSQLPPPPQLHPSPSFPQDTLNAPHASHPPREHHLQPPGANFPSQPLPVERYPSHRPPFVDYHSQHAPPPNHSWASLPPPPFANESAPGPAIPNSDFRPLQFQQNPMLPRNNGPQLLSRPFPTDIPPQYRTFPSMEDHRQPSVDNLRDHSFGGSNFMREHRFMHPTMPEGQFNTGHLQDYHSHPLPPLREEVPGSLSVRENVGSFQPLQDPRITSSSSLTPQTIHSQPPPPFPREPSQMHSYGSQLPISGGFSSHMGVPGNVDSSLSRYPSSFPVGNQPSRLSDGAGLKTSTSTHYNPFASTFEQIPASLKSNSSISRREIDSNYSSKYDSPFRLSHGPVSAQGSGGPGARHMSSPPDSGRLGGQFLPKSGRELVAGDQYDPLFDSIEPSMNVFKKFDHVHGRDSTFEPISGSVAGRANETGIALRLSSLHGPLDVEEKRKDGVATIVKPPENDEFDGAAIDAEVGTVENASPQPGEGKSWSPANPIDLTNTAVGEIEIDQVQSPNKSKKSKDSRSMKLFKIAIADFVKEVLKPSWRQGNMSKEAFKTIVKKTVDKVSGAMQSHQIPKSQAKINQYVESSQRKLTKLVMGYVDKYTKI